MEYERYFGDVCRQKVSIDIGGTLAKVAYVERAETALDSNGSDPVNFQYEGRRYQIRFRYFSTINFEELVGFLESNRHLLAHGTIKVSGGGAYKFCSRLEQELRVTVVKVDEMFAVMRGLDFILKLPHEKTCFEYDLQRDNVRLLKRPPGRYPYLLINIGSGVSILKATEPDKFERVSGTCIGGGTVLGLCKLSFGVESFSEVARLSELGTDCLDLSVSDLIGDTAGSTILPADTLASSFGRLYTNNRTTTVRKEDIARSAIKMVSYNLGYLAVLLAQVHKCESIFFAGKYISDHKFTMKTITQAVIYYSLYEKSLVGHGQLWDISDIEEAHENDPISFDELVTNLHRAERRKPPYRAIFLKHDGYLGALGCLFSDDPQKENLSS